MWGAPRPQTRFNGPVKAGGVAIIARHGTTLREVPLTDPRAIRFHAAGRLLHGVVALPSGECIHTICAYGYTNAAREQLQRQQNEELMETVCDLIAGLGNAPALFAGDLNTTLEASSVLSRAVAAQSLHDIALMQSAVDGLAAQPTCFAKDNSPGTRIDLMLANSTAIGAFQQFQLRLDINVPVHRALEASLAFEGVYQEGVRYRRPQSLPPWAPLKKEEDEDKLAWEHAAPLLEAIHQDWSLCMQGANVDWALEMASSVGAVLGVACHGSGLCSTTNAGTGNCQNPATCHNAKRHGNS